jgi:hypothetical protein
VLEIVKDFDFQDLDQDLLDEYKEKPNYKGEVLSIY